jgi:hypothetical protein
VDDVDQRCLIEKAEVGREDVAVRPRQAGHGENTNNGAGGEWEAEVLVVAGTASVRIERNGNMKRDPDRSRYRWVRKCQTAELERERTPRMSQKGMA